MKKILNILLVFVAMNSMAQISTNYFMPDSLIRTDPKLNPIQTMAGTCASPDGGMNSIAAPPPNYTYLQNNGYCNPRSYGRSGTVCWNFTPTQNSVSINSGYSQTGCTSMSFGPFTLYTCAPACAVVGSGLNFAVTPGTCYTWCMSWSGGGPPSCSVNDWCPYYQQFTTLPIELSYFAGSSQGNVNMLIWKTMTEINNDYFVLEISSDALNWSEIGRVKGAGNSKKAITYSYKHQGFTKGEINYYRLKQVNLDRTFEYHGIVAINNTKDNDTKVIRVLNMLGQEVTENYEGIKILYYADGSVEKK